jgi:hypothetical protein
VADDDIVGIVGAGEPHALGGAGWVMPTLAERIGRHQSRAAAWVRMAAGTYADYVALRSAEATAEDVAHRNGR